MKKVFYNALDFNGLVVSSNHKIYNQKNMVRYSYRFLTT